MNHTNILAEFHDEIGNMTAFVVRNTATNGFNVGLRDDDADEVVPSIKMFPAAQLDAAVAYARHLAGV